MRVGITTSIATAIAIGVLVATGGGGPFTANLFLSSTAANDCSGGRSATKITYEAAVTGNNVCQKWSTACSAATGGDNVGVRRTSVSTPDTGTPFAEETPGGAYTEMPGNCSDGAGNNIDPTVLAVGTVPEDVISNWVTFECADAPQDSVVLDVKYFIPSGASHAYIKGNCFIFGQILTDFEGSNGTQSSNFITDDVHMQSFQVTGSDNVWFTSSTDQWEFGPIVLCYQDGSAAAEAEECDATGTGNCGQASCIGWYETRWANRSNGSSDLQSQGRVNPDGDGNTATDVLIENVWWHDSQSKNSVALHSGCGFLLDNRVAETTNVIYRNILCERVVEKGMFLSNSNGLTYENSQVACPVEPLETSGENNWGQTGCAQRGFSFNCGELGQENCSDVLVRYNNFVTQVDLISNTDVGPNVRVVGNIASQYICPTDVANGDYNVYVGGSACGSNGVDIVSAPFVDTDFGTTPTTSPTIDMHLSGSPGSHGFEDDISTATSDYALTKDMDLQPRPADTNRDPGADERDTP